MRAKFFGQLMVQINAVVNIEFVFRISNSSFMKDVNIGALQYRLRDFSYFNYRMRWQRSELMLNNETHVEQTFNYQEFYSAI
jgi:hypothetical protein